MLKKFFLMVFVLAIPTGVFADSNRWLLKISDAAANINFSGTFVYLHDGQADTMQVARRIDNGLSQTRLYSLSGQPREIITGMNKVWCYIPDQNVVVHDHRQSRISGFPRILPSDLDALKQNYEFTVQAVERIADREAQEIRVIPKDTFRYGYSLWADVDTGLLLRSDLIGENGEIVEQYLFVEVEIGGDIDDSALAPVSNIEELQLFGNSLPRATPAESSRWNVTKIPIGYTLNKHIKRMSPMDMQPVEHMIFTDGLSTVSVFIKQVKPSQSELTGLSKMGAVHAYRTTVDNHRITVIGEVPASTVEYLALGISL